MNAFSQLGNALVGGDADIPISGRVGYFSQKGDAFLQICERIIDFTFYPVDGKNHCYKAYREDVLEDYKFDKGGLVGLGFMVFILLIFCIILSTLFWSYYGIKKAIGGK